jgi:FkbM family methyltransferase
VNSLDVARKMVRALHLRKLIFAGANAYARIRPRRLCVRDGIRYQVDLTEVIDQGIWLYGWEPATIALLKSHTSPGDTVIEVGANVGAHTLLLAKLVGPSGTVYAFEPTEYAQGKLRTNMELNPDLKARIVIRSELVTNHAGQTPVRRIKSSFPIRSGGTPDEVVGAAAVALDNEEFDRVNLLKIDVDGYDFKVLEGAAKLLERFKPYVLIELYEAALNAQGDSVRDIFGLLRSHGYNGIYENGTPIVSAEEILAKVGSTTSVNGFFTAQA